MRRFELRRDFDETGISGTGVVAQGIQWDNGWCQVMWLTKVFSTTTYPDIESVEFIHGHGGKTVVQWLDPEVRLEPEAETTEGITREDVEREMEYLGMIDPKAGQKIPLHETITGHQIVATARKLRMLESLLLAVFVALALFCSTVVPPVVAAGCERGHVYDASGLRVQETCQVVSGGTVQGQPCPIELQQTDGGGIGASTAREAAERTYKVMCAEWYNATVLGVRGNGNLSPDGLSSNMPIRPSAVQLH